MYHSFIQKVQGYVLYICLVFDNFCCLLVGLRHHLRAIENKKPVIPDCYAHVQHSANHARYQCWRVKTRLYTIQLYQL